MSAAARARAFLRSASQETSKTETAKLFGCSRQALYGKGLMDLKDEELRERILPVMDENPAYGYRRVAIDLREPKNKVQRVMAKFGLMARIQRKKRKGQQNQGPPRIVPSNLMSRLCPIVPNFMWAGDFTEFLLWRRRRIFLATVIDVFTREIVGWNIGQHHTAGLVIEALEDAFKRRGIAPCVFHSDQGSEYTSWECAFWIASHSVCPSWSPKGKPWVNGRKESFYSHFKLEIGDMGKVGSIPDFYEAVSRQIRYYNQKRIHSRLKMSPSQFFDKHKGRASRSVLWDQSLLA